MSLLTRVPYAERVLQPVGCKTQFPSARANSVTVRTYRTKHFIPAGCRSLRLVYANSYLSTGTVAETNTGNAIAVKCSIETQAGAIHPVSWGGSRTRTLAQGAYALSDPVAISVLAGAGFVWVRCCVTVGAGEYYPTGWTTHSGDGEGSFDGDRADSGVVAAGTVAGFYPLAILGVTNGSAPSVAVIGDSIAQGARDYSWRSGYPAGGGWFARALDGVMAFTQFAQSGDRLLWQQDNTKRPILHALLGLYRHAFIATGINDVTNATSLANMQAYALALANRVRAAGRVPHLATLTPVTTSTDAWTTAGNQALHAQDAIRVAYNAWALTVPASFATAADFAAQVQDGDGKWVCPGTVLDSGAASGGAGNNLTDTAKAWVGNTYYGCAAISITGGTGAGQLYACSTAGGNTPTVFYVNPNEFAPVPDATSTYEILRTLTTDGTHPGSTAHVLMATALDPATRFAV